MPHLEDLLVSFTERYRKQKLLTCCLAEFVGTFLLVSFGLGFTSNAILLGSPVGLFEGAILWGFALTIAIYTTASISNGHLNPAVSIAMAVMRSKEFSPQYCAAYILSQLSGSFFAALVNFWIFLPALKKYESENGIVRGSTASITSSSIYGEYFPNPAVIPHLGGQNEAGGSFAHGFFVEAWGTGLLMFLILAIVDKNQNTLKNKELVPLVIGIALTSIVAVVSTQTEAGLNPARDFGARLVAFCYGYGKLAIPGPSYEVVAYIFGPILGAIAGAIAHDLLIAPGLRRSSKPYETYQAKIHELLLQRSLRDLSSGESLGTESESHQLPSGGSRGNKAQGGVLPVAPVASS